MQEKFIREASPEDLLTAWELNSSKIMALLEYILLLRVQIHNSIPANQFSDQIFVENLEHNLKQLKALQE